MIPAVLFITSAVVRFVKFGFPAEVVFDEVHNGYYLNAYWHGQYFFDVHPPLAKMLEAAFGWLVGANDTVVDWTTIGNALPPSAVLLRLLPLAAGILLPVIVYAILRRLEISKSSAFAAGLLVAFENSFIVQSRFVLFDGIMLVFGFLAILFYLEWRRRLRIDKEASGNGVGDKSVFKHRFLTYLSLAFSMIFAASALSVKWTGLSFLGMIVLMEAYWLYGSAAGKGVKTKVVATMKKIIPFSVSYLACAVLVYVVVFAVHFALLPNSGRGDAFMTPAFQKTLSGSIYADDPSVSSDKSFAGKFLELNARMFKSDLGLTNEHAYSSRWYSWPFMNRTIFYWQGYSACNGQDPCPNSGSHSYIYYMGNPTVYWLGATTILWLLLHGLRAVPRLRRQILFVLVGFAANFLPFILIGRVMFLYHYEAALIFSIMAIAVFLEALPDKGKRAATVAVVCLSILSFLYWSPLTYGTPLSDAALKQRMWVSSWR